MSTQIDDLIAMRDIESLYELMTEDEDWLTQFDAAEGLIQLGDRRGYEFVATATLSDDDEILEVAKEIQDSSEFKNMRRAIEAELASAQRAHLESAKKRLQKGGKVYRYKMLYLPANALAGNDPLSQGFEIPALDGFGLEGWEVAHVIDANAQVTGAYFLLQKEILPSESADLEKS